MEIIKLNNNYNKVVDRATEVIRAGGLVVFPSDSVYGLAVDPTNELAVKKLLAFKERWPGKAISIAVLDEKMAEKYIEVNSEVESIFKTLLPGPFTIVAKGLHTVTPGIEANNGTLGIRIPDYKLISEIVRKLNSPITATSANLSGKTPHYSVESFLKTLSQKKKEMIDLIIDGGKLPKNLPSTVIDLSGGEIEILRRGDMMVGSTGQTLISKSEKETEKIAVFILKRAQASSAPTVFGLSGELGTGKTVFSRAIGKYLGIKEKITSPTFVIYNEYSISPNPKTLTSNPFPLTGQGEFWKFLHFDLYRLANKFEFEEIKFLEQFSSTGSEQVVACIEWPEMMGEEIFKKLKEKVNYVPVVFRYVKEGTREIEF